MDGPDPAAVAAAKDYERRHNTHARKRACVCVPDKHGYAHAYARKERRRQARPNEYVRERTKERTNTRTLTLSAMAFNQFIECSIRWFFSSSRQVQSAIVSTYETLYANTW